MSLIVCALLSLAMPVALQTPSMTLPAHDAFSEPNGDAFEFEQNAPLSGWKDGKQAIVWYGELKHAGQLHLGLTTQGPDATLRLTLSGQAKPKGAWTKLPAITRLATGGAVDFGTVTIPHAGFWRFALSGVRKTGDTFGAPTGLTLSGEALVDADINRSRWRTPASDHLSYPIPAGVKATWAYNEVRATEDPIHTYYCAIGFGRGYFGMQVNGFHERRIIFSVWDAGKEAVDPTKVSADDRVKLIAKGAGVYTDRFGNEGTGGHSHLIYNWKTGQKQRFLVTAKLDGTGTIYSGYFFFPDRKKWDLIASFRAPHDGGYLNGLYSFNEVFGGTQGQRYRRAEFGPQFVRDTAEQWHELTTARFTHTAHGEPLVRHDWGGGPIGDRFFLENGGFITTHQDYGATFTRTPWKQGPPTDIKLPD